MSIGSNSIPNRFVKVVYTDGSFTMHVSPFQDGSEGQLEFAEKMFWEDDVVAVSIITKYYR